MQIENTQNTNTKYKFDIQFKFLKILKVLTLKASFPGKSGIVF